MMRLSELAAAVGGELVGEDVLFTSVGTDSRNIVPGQLFIALRGERFDGHAYVLQALQSGAAAALVAEAQPGMAAGVVVKNTRLALGQLAAVWRNRFSIPVAAITGSNGKTTVKEMVASILRAEAGDSNAVLATRGNLNNDIGLPLTLLRLRPSHKYTVAEMGMNHFGEIRYLSQMARPTVALVNNATSAHLGGLGSVEGIARAKGEIFEGLALEGMAVINADDLYAPLWTELAGEHDILTFGLAKMADVTANYELRADTSYVYMKSPIGGIAFNLQVAGLHNVRNALAASTVAIAMGARPESIAKGLEAFDGVDGRLQHRAGIGQALVIDDTYNANPASMRAAIDVLAARPGKRLLVLGDMGELGETAAAMHTEIGQYAREAGINGLYTLGDLSLEMSKAFGDPAHHYKTPEQLVAGLCHEMDANTVVLVKGSRFMRMERVVQLIVSEQNNTKEEAH
ncbi:UDP-N-acetylmuramoyl-tripeptide--D-alanyl-D-alanine ligase [Methylovorus glucosotrophus]|uniref:UDP-N-acetylmuramoyl-tripeptide--D-alanyl-D-alanine ligase n=2 Tax=Methylovorus TaxID=81682 RepID=C6X984_METGS|nr:UDP-N-acetylmuramoyl-tripeptide--D-alanyl-D-alanine ligase [Methylovorus glucosotrophus]ACT49704.1 UDP-N-acetylmuramoylalanyl-D-glutamyl-2,6-diaminopimelate/D-alanyl-D-alanyl ligase [Methylovorus glucosotrophus SIP3-4]